MATGGVRASSTVLRGTSGPRNTTNGIRASKTASTSPGSQKVPTGIAGQKWRRVKPDRWLRSDKVMRWD